MKKKRWMFLKEEESKRKVAKKLRSASEVLFILIETHKSIK